MFSRIGKQRITFDLFAGCGGLSTGLEFAGFNPILVSELNDDARESFVVNRSTTLGGEKFSQLKDLHFGDVSELLRGIEGTFALLHELFRTQSKTVESLNLDLLCGGPPCQGYSGIGHRRSYHVDKKDIPSNRLYEKMAELIERSQPKLFLFENVKGILSGRWTEAGRKGEIWDSVFGRFNSIKGYTVKYSLVQAKNYGVPQNRPRVLLVGIRNDVAARSGVDWLSSSVDAINCGFLPPPSEERHYPDIDDLLSDLVDESVANQLASQEFSPNFSTRRYLKNPASLIQKWLRTCPDGSLLSKGDVLLEQEYSRHKSAVVSKFAAMHANEGKIPDELKTKKFAQRLLPAKWGDTGPTITATSLPDDYVHYLQPRTLTVREWARLQTFPDWYKFAGKRTTGGLRRAGNPREGNFEREVPKYTQIGNAVPVKLAECVGYHFNEILNRAGY